MHSIQCFKAALLEQSAKISQNFLKQSKKVIDLIVQTAGEENGKTLGPLLDLTMLLLYNKRDEN